MYLVIVYGHHLPLGAFEHDLYIMLACAKMVVQRAYFTFGLSTQAIILAQFDYKCVVFIIKLCIFRQVLHEKILHTLVVYTVIKKSHSEENPLRIGIDYKMGFLAA
jgi:hypothetical protein